MAVSNSKKLYLVDESYFIWECKNNFGIREN